MCSRNDQGVHLTTSDSLNEHGDSLHYWGGEGKGVKLDRLRDGPL